MTQIFSFEGEQDVAFHVVICQWFCPHRTLNDSKMGRTSYGFI